MKMLKKKKILFTDAGVEWALGEKPFSFISIAASASRSSQRIRHHANHCSLRGRPQSDLKFFTII